MPNNYWRDRELKHIEESIKNDEKLARRLRHLHLEAMEEIEAQIEAFYGRYATAEGISMSEARKRVSKLDIEKYERKAKRYVREKNFSERANEEMRLYNAAMKINRLELLKANIHLELLAMTSEAQRVIYEALTEKAKEEYERQAGILGETIAYSEMNIAAIVSASFLTATWSDRLWSNQVALRAELEKLLSKGIVQGKNPRDLARELRKVFNASIYNSERLLITEMARVQADVFKESMRKEGIYWYEYIAEPTACSVCAALDGEVFKVEDAEIGKNMYPMHPNCKCSTAAYIDRELFEKDLEERGL